MQDLDPVIARQLYDCPLLLGRPPWASCNWVFESDTIFSVEKASFLICFFMALFRFDCLKFVFFDCFDDTKMQHHRGRFQYQLVCIFEQKVL